MIPAQEEHPEQAEQQASHSISFSVPDVPDVPDERGGRSDQGLDDDEQSDDQEVVRI